MMGSLSLGRDMRGSQSLDGCALELFRFSLNASHQANTDSSKAVDDGKQSKAELQYQQRQLWSVHLLSLYFPVSQLSGDQASNEASTVLASAFPSSAKGPLSDPG